MEPDNTSLSRQHPAQARWLRLLLVITALLLAVGLAAPVVTLQKFVLIENTFSVLSGVWQLLQEGQWFLFFIITGFSVVLPLLKIGILFRLVTGYGYRDDQLRRYLHWMHLYGRWSMLDVFVVAVLVVSVKLGAIADVEMRYGLYAFAASVLLTMYITARIVSLTNDPG